MGTELVQEEALLVKGGPMTERRLAMQISIDFALEADTDADTFHAHGAELMEELLKLEACDPEITDASVGTDAGEGTITVDLLVYAADEPDGLQKALDVIRAAAHAAGAATPYWPVVVVEPKETRISRTLVEA
ncbi:hypothetical protein [Longispora albida]|uniref:hypothetical protein n=1 Tax=Longispora albida TaxID=203523 RepID=UPI000368B5D3|nr:hypothetical protein [Longispora albida]